jgi:hypothetical protein
MERSFVRRFIALWLLLEWLLSWTIAYKEPQICILGHCAILIGALWALVKSKRTSTLVSLSLSGTPPEPHNKVRMLRKRRYHRHETKAA